jgi:hypothetical protein
MTLSDANTTLDIALIFSKIEVPHLSALSVSKMESLGRLIIYKTLDSFWTMLLQMVYEM